MTTILARGLEIVVSNGPLSGLRILELGHFIAAPFCTRLLGDLGADIIKIEPPAGDPVRQWGKMVNGVSPWWSMHGRNKRSVTVNLKHPDAAHLVLGLVADCDAVVENFRPGHLEKLGLGAETLKRSRPDLVIARITGFGQDGPYRDRAAFGVIGEAIGGLRHLTNHAPGTTDLPPVRAGVSLGDSVAGLYAAFGVMAALWQRDRAGGDRRWREVDVALTESVLSLMEGLLPEYSTLGEIRQPTGSRIVTAAPTSAYRTRDDKWILIAANSDPLFARLADLIGRPELARDSRYIGNRERVKNVETLDAIIEGWTMQRSVDEAYSLMCEVDIPCTQVYTAAECATDPQFIHRGMVRQIIDSQIGPVLHAGIVPHLPDDPGTIRWPGPPIGAHTDEVLKQLLNLPQSRIDELRGEGVI